MTDNNIPKAGDFYRHFKNKLYQIVTIAYHSETGEPMVVYQALYGDYKNYIRPLDMFVSEVDHKKYPEVIQKYRFEKIILKNSDHDEMEIEENPVDRVESCNDIKEEKYVDDTDDSNANPYLVRFLDCDNYEDKKSVLMESRNNMSQTDIDSICMALSITGFGGDIKQQISSLVSFLDMQKRYEGGRLRP